MDDASQFDEWLSQVDYKFEILDEISTDGHRLKGRFGLTNVSDDISIPFDLPNKTGAIIGWRLQLTDGSVHEGRIYPEGELLPHESIPFEFDIALPYSMEGNVWLVVDLLVETVAWLGVDHSERTIALPLTVPPNVLFDAEWYRESYDLPASMSVAEIEQHFKMVGIKYGHSTSPFICPSFVLDQAAKRPDIRGTDPTKIFLENFDSLDPHPLLPKVAHTFGTVDLPSPLPDGVLGNQSWCILRYLDSQSVRHSPFFDPSYITEDDGTPARNPLRRFLRDLYDTETKPSALFDPQYYLASNPDVRRLVNERKDLRSALQHFLRYGMRENRSPIPDFDADYYKQRYPEVAQAEQDGVMSATEHFFFFGIAEGRNPNPFFDTAYYLDAQPSVPEECRRMGLSGPFEHFLKVGYSRGYKTSPPLVSRELPDWMGKSAYEKRCRVTATTLVRHKRKFKFPKVSATPDLTCIIPVYNQFEMTVHLLSQLEDFAWRADTPETEIVVVDNGSSDLTTDLAEFVENITLHRADAPLGYTKACNIGAKLATGRVLLFMNNDVEINSSSLRQGVERLDEDASIGSVGGRIILMNGQLQEAGSEIFSDGGTMGVGRYDDPTHIRHSFERAVPYTSGCFLFVRRSDFEALDGLDETFSPGYYEETDLCFRLQEQGLINLYDPTIYLYHYEYATYSKGRPPAISTTLMLKNRGVFTKKYGKELSDCPIAGSDMRADLLEARQASGEKSIAIVEDLIPDPKLGSGFVRSMDVLEALVKMGHRVTVFVRNFVHSDEYARLQSRGIRIIPCYTADARQNPLEGREFDYDVLWVGRTHNFGTWAGFHRAAKLVNPELKLVFDTEAVSSLREIEYRKIHQLPPPSDIERMVFDELGVDLLPDCIVAVNGIDQAWSEKFARCPVTVIGHAMQARDDVPDLSNRNGIYFCGSFHGVDTPNYDSIKWFLTEVWPLILKRRPDIEFRFSGHVGADVDIPALVGDARNVRFLGKVPDVRAELDRARISIAPTRYSGGIPHKVHESLASGVPTVCTDLLARQLCPVGMDVDDLPVSSAPHTDPEAWAELCIWLLEDDDTWAEASAAALRFIDQHNSIELFDEAVGETLAKACQEDD